MPYIVALISFVIILTFLAFTLIIKLKTKPPIVIALIIPLFILTIPFMVPHESLNRMHFNFNQADISQAGVTDGLSLKKNGNSNVLYDNMNKRNVSYHDHNQRADIYGYMPVYLRDTGHYYEVVFSTDPDKDYKNGRFIQNDYEFYQTDELYFIRKSDGYAFYFKKYDDIGKTIDLNSFHEINNKEITYSVYADFEADIASYGVMIINETTDLSQFRYITEDVTGMVQFVFPNQNDDVYIKTFAAGDDLVFMWVTSDNKVYYATDMHYYFDTNSFGMNRGPVKEGYEDQPYLVNGYLTSHNGSVYFVDNALNIQRLNKDESLTPIAHVTNLDEWKSLLP